MTLYQPHHESQYAPGSSQRTRRSGCTWTTGATGADAATGGDRDRTPDYVLGLVKPYEETNPATPGWSIGDLALAMRRLGVPFAVRSGQGWGAVLEAHADGLYIVLQGDSDQFGNQTCSGAFDGDHCIGIRPGSSVGGRWLIDDPICPDDRYERTDTLFRYARKFSATINFGVFLTPVPQMGWSASVTPVHPKKTRRFFVYQVRNVVQRPLVIESRTAAQTRGFTASSSAPINAIAAPGFKGQTPALVLLASGARRGQYISAEYAKENT